MVDPRTQRVGGRGRSIVLTGRAPGDSPASALLGTTLVGRGLAGRALALGGAFGTLDGLAFLALFAFLDDRLFLDLDPRRLDLGDDLVRIGEQRDVFWDREVTDVDRRVEVHQGVDGVLDRLRQVVWQCLDSDALG